MINLRIFKNIKVLASRQFNLTCFNLGFLLLGLIVTFNLKAAVVPDTVQIVLGSSAPVNVTWRYNTGPMGNGTADSAQGIFINPNAREVLGVNSTRLSRVTMANQMVSIPENIQIPASVLSAARAAGLQSFQYQRTFNIGTDPASGAPGMVVTDTLTIQVKSVSELSISRIALRFDNDQVFRTLGQKEQTFAIAQISYQNAGLLDAVWEVATPPSTNSQPFYRPIQNIRRYLGASGNALIQSPMLPTDISGNYLIRLRVKQPQLREPVTELRYRVTGNITKDLTALAKIRVMSPATNSNLTPSTEFHWQSVPGATAYQLEIFSTSAFNMVDKTARYAEEQKTMNRFQIPKGEPTTGILVPGEKNRLSLSLVSLQHLNSNRQYMWRVLAVDANGKIVAVSPIREIRTP